MARTALTLVFNIYPTHSRTVDSHMDTVISSMPFESVTSPDHCDKTDMAQLIWGSNEVYNINIKKNKKKRKYPILWSLVNSFLCLQISSQAKGSYVNYTAVKLIPKAHHSFPTQRHWHCDIFLYPSWSSTTQPDKFHLLSLKPASWNGTYHNLKSAHAKTVLSYDNENTWICNHNWNFLKKGARTYPQQKGEYICQARE